MGDGQGQNIHNRVGKVCKSRGAQKAVHMRQCALRLDGRPSRDSGEGEQRVVHQMRTSPGQR